MFRFFTISTALHCGAILILLVLGFIAPPMRKIPPRMFVNLSPFNRGTPGLPPGDPNPRPAAVAPEPESPKATPAPEKKAEEPAPTPAPTPAATPQSTPAPPRPTQPPIVQPKKTPEPKSEPVITKKAPPTVKEAKPAKKVAEAAKKKIIKPDKNKLVQPTHTPKPTPEPAPEDAVVADVTEAAQPVQPQEHQTAEFNAPAVPVQPPAPAPVKTPAPAGAGGAGTAQKASPGGALKGGIGPAGGGGGNGGNGPGFGYGQMINDLAQTYFAVVLARLEENFRPPYASPGVQCVVQFVIEKTGTISNIKIVQPTGREGLDHFAVQALESTKLPELYDGMRISSLPVIITFSYDNKR